MPDTTEEVSSIAPLNQSPAPPYGEVKSPPRSWQAGFAPAARRVAPLLSTAVECLLLFLVTFVMSASAVDFVGRPGPVIFTPAAYTVETKEPQPRISESLLPIQAVFFKNGDATLLGDSVLATSVLAKTINCPDSRVVIVPWVSSAPYANDPKGERNLVLAGQRGDVVGRAIKRYAPLSQAEIDNWDTFELLRTKLSFDDHRGLPHAENPNERLNRRVDIKILKTCVGGSSERQSASN
jgi:hypothetical protein